jgi:hypothetical protein
MHLRRFVEEILDDGPHMELAALFAACSWLRGWDARNARLALWARDADTWIKRHGRPTRQKLLSWVDSLGVEAEIPEPLVRMNLLGAAPPNAYSPQVAGS